jgi:hypothetical protein
MMMSLLAVAVFSFQFLVFSKAISRTFTPAEN